MQDKSENMTASSRGRWERVQGRYYLAIFAIALLLRMIFLASRWEMLPDWNVDALGYQQLAVNLLMHHVFSMSAQPPYQPDVIRTPGYPFFLAAIYAIGGIAPRWVLVVQAILDSMTALLVMGVSLALSRSKNKALVAGLLYAFSPVAWRYSAELYVEIVLAFLITLTFYVALRTLASKGRGWVNAVLLGILVALSVMVKPNVILLPVIIGGVLLIKRRWRQAVIFTGLMVILLAPWVARNARVFGHPTLSTVFQNNLARVSAPAVLAAVEGEDVAPWTPRWEEFFYQITATAASRNPDLFATPSQELKPEQSYQIQVALASVAREIILAHPAAFLRSYLMGALRGWMPQEQRFWFEQFSGQRWERIFPAGIASQILRGNWQSAPFLALALFLFFLILRVTGVIAGAYGVWRLFWENRVMVVAMVLLILYVTTLPGPIAYVRFHIPVLPLMMVFVAEGALSFFHRA